MPALPDRRRCHSSPLGGNGLPEIISYRVIPSENTSHWMEAAGGRAGGEGVSARRNAPIYDVKPAPYLVYHGRILHWLLRMPAPHITTVLLHPLLF